MKEVKAVVMTFVLYCPTTETQGMGGRRPVAAMFLNLQLYVLHHFFFFFLNTFQLFSVDFNQNCWEEKMKDILIPDEAPK